MRRHCHPVTITRIHTEFKPEFNRDKKKSLYILLNAFTSKNVTEYGKELYLWKNAISLCK
jgi:hypothetical protein